MLSEENEPKETMVLILDRYSKIGAHKDFDQTTPTTCGLILVI